MPFSARPWPVFSVAALACVAAWSLWPTAPTRAAVGSVTADAPAEDAQRAAAPAVAPVMAASAAPPPTTNRRQSEDPRPPPTVRALDAYRLWATYPPSSRPASESPSALHPSPMIGAVLPLDPRASDGVRVRVAQDRRFLGAGDEAVVEVSAPQARGLVVGAGVLAPASGGSPIATVLFRDDGVVPDARASDGVWTARVATPQSVGDDAVALVVRAAVHAGGEDGEASFDFVYTGARPAELTGTVAASLDAGSLAFDVGIAVRLPGRYVFVGRLDDARGRPIAVIRFSDDLDVGPRAVRLVAFGKLLRDEHAEAPFVLRDVEGFRLTGGGASDRQLVAPWSGPFVTARHSLSDFSDRAWDDPSKRAHLAALEGVVADLPPR